MLVLKTRQHGRVPRRSRSGRVVDGLRVVQSGLKPGERVVINGLHARASRDEGRRHRLLRWSSPESRRRLRRRARASHDSNSEYHQVRFSRFFIDRPIFAVVLSLVILAGGLIAITRLPISEYPEVAPPTITVRAMYPGANPTVLAQTVGTPLEEAINGVERHAVHVVVGDRRRHAHSHRHLRDRHRRRSRAGAGAEPREPGAARDCRKKCARSASRPRSARPTSRWSCTSSRPDGRYDPVYLRNYALLNVRNELARIPGAGQVIVFGAGDYAMRVWLDPNKVAARGLSASDVVQAIREQNVQVAAGRVGAPADAGSGRISAHGERAGPARGRRGVRQHHRQDRRRTARSRACATSRASSSAPATYALRALLDNKPAVAIVVFQAPGSNALALSSDVRAKMAELEDALPAGRRLVVVYDPTVFVRDSIREVIHTLLEATLLVVHRRRAVPADVARVDHPARRGAGLDRRHVRGDARGRASRSTRCRCSDSCWRSASSSTTPSSSSRTSSGTSRKGSRRSRRATRAMEEVSGPIIAIALVLCAVFVPVAFISGLTGQFYRQFALTIAFSTLISAFNSLTLSPALAAVLLKPRGAPDDAPTRVMNRGFGWLFGPFNRALRAAPTRYGNVVTRVTRRSAHRARGLRRTRCCSASSASRGCPAGFVPEPGQAVPRRHRAAARRGFARSHRSRHPPDGGHRARRQPGVEHAVAVPRPLDQRLRQQAERGRSSSSASSRSRSGSQGPETSSGAIVVALNQKFSAIQDAFVARLPAAGGERPRRDRRLQADDRGSRGARRLGALRDDAGTARPRVSDAAARRRVLRASRSTCRSSSPTSIATR